jgi:hypothetical protein
MNIDDRKSAQWISFAIFMPMIAEKFVNEPFWRLFINLLAITFILIIFNLH